MDRIDEIDVKILTLLQARGRMKRNRIAEEVGLSVPSVSERMRKLEERGVIQGYHAVVDPKRLHIDITAFIRVTVDGSSNYPAFVERARQLDEVLEVHSVTGEGSHILKVRTKNTTTLERLLSTIQSWPGVHGTSTSIVLSTYKETRALAVQPTELFYPEEELV
ncbi:MAG: AsnC family transcriptional regulator [Rhodothermaceae bacterium]|nr:MAG: AsnC family transcriptional regulator [Rhodothermaceae bacterium]